MYLNAATEREKIDKVIEKITYLISLNAFSSLGKHEQGSASGAAILAGVDSLSETGGRVMLFSANYCIKGFGSSAFRDENSLYGTPNEETVFRPQVVLLYRMMHLVSSVMSL